ncbi:hypothetical protein FS837_003821 [Tulasnella sp. UAMH 9824]|nr:hypothetical protein FS837_003821 [Tulasnella sp. UAMH 9824]
MADSPAPAANGTANQQQSTNGNRGGRGGGPRQGGGRNPRRANSTSAADPSAANAPAQGGQQGGQGGGNRTRNANSNKKTSPNPGAAAAVVEESASSRPSSTDGTTRSNNLGANGGNRGGKNNRSVSNPGGNRPGGQQQRKGRTASTNSPNPGKGQPLPAAGSSATQPGGQQGSTALTSLQRVITDLKSYPSQSSPLSGSGPALPSSTTSTLPVNAPVFQPGAPLHPAASAGAGGHRKAASTGTGPGFSPAFSSPLNTFSPHLGVMQEDIPEEHEDDDGDIVITQQQPRAIAQSTMGNFTAPRFNQQQQQQAPDQDVGPTGRPQLAPNFMFGQRRNQINQPALTDEDVGFQFPQASQQQTLAGLAQQAPTTHRRTPSELAGVSPLMAEQIAIQNQIEALQAQQQQLLQQQLATNTVMGSLSIQGAGRGGLANAAHRRIQSQQVPMGLGFPQAFNNSPMGGFGGLGGGVGLGIAGGQDAGGNKGSHGRRHSVNVINKAAEQGGAAAGLYNGAQNDGFDDGFMPSLPGGHSRQASRADSSWRMNGGNAAAFSQDGLAQAQAQLASLAQFRAAAGGHHQKMPSFALPNMLPNMMAANMMGLGGYNLLQQQQQFQMQLQQQQNQGPQRKSLFAPYLPQASLPPLLAAGKLVVGILRVNKRNRSDAYVATEVLDSDIYICGSKDRNRALEGDIVAVELLDVDEVWGTKKEKEEKKRKKEESASYDPRAVAGRKNDKKKDDVEVEGQGLMLFEDEEVTDEIKPQFAGHVVAVVERMPGQLFSGTLGLLRPSSAATKEKQEAERRERNGGEEEPQKPLERPKIVWFKPTDKRVPLIAIPTEQAPPDFVNNSDAYADRLFVACIKRHPISSLHPFGTLVEELGPIGEVEVETSALLKDCNFPTEDFTENVIKCVPPVPWAIPEREFETRRDLRDECIFTIDPSSAKDLDDALSIKRKEDGNFEVGVHVADVSYFVKPNTALDRDARKRATTVYLIQRAVPMLPPTLSEELCSLNPGQDKLAFSAIFTITEEGRVIDKWFGKTIIRSAAKLSYYDAQRVIEGDTLPMTVNAPPEHPASEIAENIRLLENLASRLRKDRFDHGTLSISELKLRFSLDDKGKPIDCDAEEQNEANRLVEEFMLLANLAVAREIAYHLPEQAMLRRHQEPLERRINAFAERAKRSGVSIDTSSAGAIQRSLNNIKDLPTRRMFEALLRKSMHSAAYFCAGMIDIAKYNHYAMNEPLYTHFTSPIRRYADILVHRQLESVLNGGANEAKFNMDRDAVAKIAQQCNIKKRNAKLAQEQSAHLFLCLLVSDLTQRFGPVIRQARVVGVLDSAFDVLIPEFGIEKRVHVDQMPIENHVYDEHSHTLQIYWSDKDVITWLAETSDDEHLRKVKKNAEQHAAKMEVNSLSVHDENALFDEDDDDEDEVVLNRSSDQKKLEKIETSKQRQISAAKAAPTFQGLRQSSAGQNIQDIRELMTVPVIVTADLTKSPPVIKVYSVNPYAQN